MSVSCVRAGRVLVVSALTAASLAGVAPAEAAKAPVRTSIAIHLTPATALVKTTAVVSGTVAPTGGTLVLQRFLHGKWTTVERAKATKLGTFSFSVRAPKVSATWPLRVARAAGKTTKAGASAVVTLRTVTAGYVVVAVHFGSVTAPTPVEVAGAVLPKASGSVLLQKLAGRQWVTVASAKLTSTSTFSVSTSQPSGTVKLRVVKPYTPRTATGTSASLTVSVLPQPVPSVTTVVLPQGRVGVPYATALTAAGGTPGYSWSATGLPAGLTLSSAGLLTGTPLAKGTVTVMATLTDGLGRTASQALALVIGAPAGRLLSVGYNANGQLGNGTTYDAATFVPVAGQLDAVAVAGGPTQAYAVDADGSLWAWGDNTYGELGTGNTTGSNVPVRVGGLTGITQVAALDQGAIALSSDGTVWGWGDNTYGEVGDGTTTARLTPVQVTGLSTVVAIATGGETAFALRSDGTVWAWGEGGLGILGNGNHANQPTPEQIPGLASVVAIAAADSAGFALQADGVVESWGEGTYGQLGTGTTANEVDTPAPITSLPKVVAVSGGELDGYAVASSGQVFAWGNDNDGGLGIGSTGFSYVPVAVHTITGAVAVSGVGRSATVLTADGSVWVWGYNSNGQLGNGTAVTAGEPIHPIGVPTAVAIAVGRGSLSTYLIE